VNIAEALQGIHHLAIETAPYIYFVENHPIYAEKVEVIFEIVETQAIDITTSVMTLTETLMKPLQANDQQLIDTYNNLLTQNVRLVPITAAIARLAAELRARYNLRTPDALHIATAIDAGCDAFLTNDFTLKRVQELTILVLDELELPESNQP
jgi:predicted nucleic acid-binding protein